MIGIVALIVFPIMIYRAAVQYERKPTLWVLLGLGLGLFFQIFMPLIVAGIIGIVMALQGADVAEIEASFDGAWMMILGWVALVLSIASMGWVYLKVSNPVELDEDFVHPPPPVFDRQEDNVDIYENTDDNRPNPERKSF